MQILFSILKAIRGKVGWVWLTRLASHTGLIHLFLSKPKFTPCVPSSKFTLRHPWAYRATKFKTTKFNSGGLFQLFTKMSTHKNNSLYGILSIRNLLYKVVTMLLYKLRTNATFYCVNDSERHGNTKWRLEHSCLWGELLLICSSGYPPQALSCSEEARVVRSAATLFAHLRWS